MIIYIHGFGSHGLGEKANIFREYCKSKDVPFIAPSLSFIPDLAVQTLEELINSYDKVNLIGSSLGGFYAIYLSEKYGLKSALINPSVYPYETLKKHVGRVPNFYDESFFQWDSRHLEILKQYATAISKQENFFLLLQKDDDILDFNEALQKFPKSKQVVEEGGSHGFDGIDRYTKNVLDFFK